MPTIHYVVMLLLLLSLMMSDSLSTDSFPYNYITNHVYLNKLFA